MAKETILTDIPTSLYGICSVKMGDKIYLFGGHNGISNVDTIYEYNIATDSYTLLTWSLPTPLRGMVGVSVESTIYLFGGVDGTNTPNYNVYKFTTGGGVVSGSADPTTITPDNAMYYVEQGGLYPQVVLTNKSTTINVMDLDDGDISSSSAPLETYYNFYTQQFWLTMDSTTLHVYEADDIAVGDLLFDKVIPSSYDSVEKIECIDTYNFLIVTVKNGARKMWRYNAYENTISQQRAIIYYSQCGVVTDYDNHLWFFGGASDEILPTPYDEAFEYNFNFYEVYVSRVASRINVSNTQTEIEYSERYFTTISPINSGNNWVDMSISGNYGENDITNYITYDGINANVSIPFVRDDIYINVLSPQYHENVLNISDGVILDDYDTKWMKNSNYVRVITVANDYVLDSVKVMNGSTDITSTVYDTSTKTITLPSSSWNTYTDINISIKANASFLLLKLYRTFMADNVVDKSLEYLTDVKGNAREEISPLYPVINIDGSSVNITNCNYVYIENFKRYYYVTSKECIRTNLWRLHLRVDVLMSYKDYILDLSCIVGRSASDYNKKLPDAEDIISSKPIVEIQEVKNNVFDVDSTTGTDHILVISSH